MDAASPPTASPAPRARRRWWRRALAIVLVLLLLLALLYRPLGHWAIQHFGMGALRDAGLSGTWKSSGTLLTGLAIDDLNLTGNEVAQVRSVKMRHAELDYDLWALRGGGPGKVLKKLTIQDLDVEMDMTRPGPPPKPAKPPGAKKKPELPDVVLPEIRIEHLNLRMKLPEDELLVEDFSLVLTPSAPGYIKVTVLDIPGAPRMEHVDGITRMEPSRLILEKTVLAPDLEISRLMLDLATLSRDEAAMELSVRQAPAKVELAGKSGAWFSSPTAEAKLAITGISQDTLAFWGVPASDATWRAGQVKLAVKGPVMRPDQLEMALTIEDGGVRVKDITLSDIGMEAGMSTGRFTLANLLARKGETRVTAKGQAKLPPAWDQIGKVPGDLDFILNSPELATLLPEGSEVSGQLEAVGRVGFSDGALTKSGVTASAAALRVKGVPVESAKAVVGMEQQRVTLEEVAVKLNATNTASARGWLDLSGDQPFDLQWQAEAQDLSTVPAEVRAGQFWPEKGTVRSTGNGKGTLAGLKAGDWSGLDARAVVDVTALKVKDATLDSLNLQAQASKGQVNLEQFSLRLDAENRVDGTGTLGLSVTEQPLSANVTVRLPDIAKASVWSTQFGGPALRAGRAELDWQGSGQLKPLLMESQGKVLVTGLRIGDVPEPLGLSGSVMQHGSNIGVSALKASAGPWRAEGALDWDGWHLTIPSLQGFASETKLVDLSARVPWDDGKVPVDSPVSLKIQVDSLDAAKLAAALGKEFPVEGKLEVEGAFSGTLRTLAGGLTATASQLRPVKAVEGPRLDPATVKVELAVKNGRLELDGTALQKPLQTVILTASLPLDAPALITDPDKAKNLPLKANVKLPSSSLAFLPSWVPQLRSISGTAAADLTVTGTVGSPVWQGSASVQAAQASFVSASLPTVKDLSLRARVNEKRLNLDQASVLLAGGRLNLAGGAGLENLTDPSLNFRLDADEVLLVRDENISLRANAGITCRGLLSKATVAGQVDIVRGRVFKEIEFLPLSLPNDLPPPPPATTVGTKGPPALPKPLDQWTFNVAIKTRDPVRLMGNVARGNAVADLRLSGVGARPELTGAVRLEDMWIRLPFSRLNITEGVITFNRDQPFDPQIDVTGESINGNRIVQVFVQGRALDPKVRLTSSPPLPEGEIAALLATGVTTSDLSSSGDEAAGRAAYVVLKQTYRKLFRKSALDDDDDEPPRLSFDFSVFGNDPSRRGVSAIYELNPKWRLIGRVGETGTFRGMLHYLIRFR